MKATCPTDPSHETFTTDVQVTEHWTVDVGGNFLDREDNATHVHGPDPDNTWTCVDCGAEADVEG